LLDVKRDRYTNDLGSKRFYFVGERVEEVIDQNNQPMT